MARLAAVSIPGALVCAVTIVVTPAACRPAPRPSGGRCQPAALQLVHEHGGNQQVVLDMDRHGTVRAAFGRAGAPAPAIVLDHEGCLTWDGEVVVELTPTGDLWTSHELIRVRGGALLVNGRELRIFKDGLVDDGQPRGAADVDVGSFRVRGYRPEAACAARMMMTLFLSMMPSMAVVDGRPHMEPAPAGSRCSGYRRMVNRAGGEPRGAPNPSHGD